MINHWDKNPAFEKRIPPETTPQKTDIRGNCGHS